MTGLPKIGFGGGCHWCTEAVFQAVKGVEKVEQGWVSSTGNDAFLSEAVLVHFNPTQVDLYHLIKIHLHTHSSTSSHSMRTKYRSAVYVFDKNQNRLAQKILDDFQKEFEGKLITRVLDFVEFKSNQEGFLNYYQKKREAAFCQTYIVPKLKKLKSLDS